MNNQSNMSNYNTCQSLEFKVLSNDQCKKILGASMEILEKTGACIYSDEALVLLKSAGANVEGKKVLIPAFLIEKAIQSAPERLVLYDRTGNKKIVLDGYNSYYGPGPTTPFFIDINNGERRKTLKQDVVNTAILCESLTNIEFVMSLAVISDCTAELTDLYEMQLMLQHTEKPIIGWAFDAVNCQDIIDMCTVVAGGIDNFRKRPFFVLYSIPTSPLMHPKDAVDKLLLMADHGLPQIYAPGMALGSTAPVTLAGSLAVGLADSLVALLLSQLKREGAPFISNATMGVMDMKTMQNTFGSPELSLGIAASTDMFRYLGLPTWSMAGCTDAKVLDEQAVLESAIQCVFSTLSGAGLIHDVGLMDNGMTASAELLTICDEIIGMVRRIMAGVEVNDNTLALATIDEVGPGGNFLGTEHTLTNFKKEIWFPTILDRNPYHKWQSEGGLTTQEKANQKIKKILSEKKYVPLDDVIIAELDRIIEKAEIRVGKKKG
jgi:trimethylamine---corrinoid protein Co-methyltransferase